MFLDEAGEFEEVIVISDDDDIVVISDDDDYIIFSDPPASPKNKYFLFIN